MRSFYLWLLFPCVALVGLACATEPPEAAAPSKIVDPLRVPPTLVLSAATLEDWLGHPDLVVLDARPEVEHAQGHLPGAVSFGTDLTFDVDDFSKLPTVPVMEERFGAAGIDETKTVVVYDEGPLRSAARVLWALQVHGHASAAVLEGGLPAWLEAGGGLERDMATPQPRSFVARVSADHLASLFETRTAIENDDVAVIDARSPAEYEGRETRWPRNGHIPKAHNVEWQRNFAAPSERGVLLDPEDLRELYGLEPGSRVIAYCTRGRRAAVTYLALRAAGFEAAVYDGSWTEWSSHLEVPVEVETAGLSDEQIEGR